MNLRQELSDKLSAIVQQKVHWIVPAHFEYGDFSTPVALALARTEKKSPHHIAQSICDAMIDHPWVEKAQEISGYVNLTLKRTVWHEVLKDILSQKERYGQHSFGQGQSVSVEYVSANPTGPLHAAHARGAVIGDVIANLLEAVGYTVAREYIINDAGNQMNKIVKSIYLHCQAMQANQNADIPEDLYPGEYVKDAAKAFLETRDFKMYSLAQWFQEIASFSTRYFMKIIQEELEMLGVNHTVFTSEKALQKSGLVQELISYLEQEQLVYTGVLPPPKGKNVSEWEEQALLLFRSTAFGDDQDRPLQRKDGSWTYFASDIAYHFDKIQRGYTQLIDIWGADHDSHVQRTQAAVLAISGKSLDVIICQMVHFSQDGVLLKMSKRTGQFISLQEILQLVPADVLRFMMLTQKASSHLVLDLQVIQEKTKENPVFYVQYAHARCCSLQRAAVDLWGEDFLSSAHLMNAPFERLLDLSMVKVLESWPHHVREAAQIREPQCITAYLYKVATEFHALWQQGQQQFTKRFLQPTDPELSRAHLAVVQAVMYVLSAGLRILGIEPQEEMK